MKTTSVCYVHSYYSPRYVRTESLVKALRQIEGLKLYLARNTSKGYRRYLETLWKLLKIRILHNPPCYMLGFRGYEFFWIVRLMTLGRVLIYDHMMSPYDSLVNEKRTVRGNGLPGRLIRLYEKSVLLASDVILTDTEIHRQFFHELFGIPLEKIAAVPVGTDEDVFQLNDSTEAAVPSDRLELLYYGSFLPLHGIDVILKAAALLREKPVRFTLIGGDRLDLSGFHQKLRQLGLDNVIHIDWVEYEELPRYIARSDLGLGGPFGDTGQAGRVITGKTFQFLAMAKPVLVGYHAGDDGFEDRVNCLQVPRGDEKALADAIAWALENREHLKGIGRAGYELYRLRYSVLQISEKLKGVISV